MSVPIPQPPRIPFIGNVASLDREVPINGFILLAKQYGEIYKLDLLGRTVISVNSYALANEVSNESKFKKVVGAALVQVRHLVGDGLFTAYNDEPNWAIAHRLLMPAFNTMSVRDMFEDMRDLCDQLLLKWERFGPENIIDPADDYTRVALDTIALCSMSYRLNSFYTNDQPKFAEAMTDFLKECFLRASRPSIVQAMMPGATAKFEEDKKFMTSVAERILNERRENPIDKKDLLNTMLLSKDPKTGQGLPDEAIINNLLTFLIAGHETSSGMMSFMTYYLIKNPETWRKLQNEVDEVTGGEPLQVQDLSKLNYLQAVMRETLRLAPTAPSRAVSPVEDVVLGGKYAVKAGAPIMMQAWTAQRDIAVWGDDANEFRPERMLDGKFEALPPNAWQPFGFGTRACIGRPFAWQEVQLIIASVAQKFDLFFDDPSYTLELQMGLTVKPKNLRIRAKRRDVSPRLYASPSSHLLQERTQKSTTQTTAPPVPVSGAKVPMYALYGSNTGTSEAFSQRIANNAPSFGFSPKLGTLDSITGSLPTDGPIVIVTASYEGQPADNAAKFVDWLSSLNADELKGVQFAIFGCGNSDWVKTYQRIPHLCDQVIEARGGERLLPIATGDSSKGNFFEVFDEFEAGLWKALTEKYSTTQSQSTSIGFEVTTVDTGASRAAALRQTDTAFGVVVENRILTKPGHPVKRHIEFELPEGLTYRAGDYLSILPQNPVRDVRRVLAYFSLSNEQMVVLSSVGPTSLPTDKPVSLYDILLGYVELSQPATTQDVRIMIDVSAPNSPAHTALEEMRTNYQEKILAPRLSVLDILEQYPKDSIKLSLGVFLKMLPPMRVRQYSISSSPLWNPQHATLTVSVLEEQALAGGDKVFLGVGSNYLSGLMKGDKVQMGVRASAVGFKLPEDPKVPILAYAAGSGLAPLRGFIQERAMQKSSGRDVAKILLFFGCRYEDGDYIYKEELQEWVKLGVLDMRPAFSREEDKSEGCRYIQDRLWKDKDEVTELFSKNAQSFICGSNKIAKGVIAKSVDILKTYHPNLTEEEASQRLEKIMQGRYATDVFD
ncbi:cytochrome P450 [Dendrothele bispora CBS 962.96]|uniref:Cytochrome P450 n=1 Tax=Dendrothele bispora (strain CBS 962.96) TaxID=1314807 RepID=A0A4S8M8K5_DENBC|nr:cytochrome P450 [Dendrothele bispora CBS 962.96]